MSEELQASSSQDQPIEALAAATSSPVGVKGKLLKAILSKLSKLIRLEFCLCLLGLYLVVFAVLNGLGSRVWRGQAECIVILGSKVEADGTPGTALTGRLELALRLYRAGVATNFATTGGRGASGSIESEAARNWLVARGVPQSNIVEEALSHTTWENLVFIAPEIRSRGWKTCLIVTDPFHMERSLMMAREIGLEVYPAPSFYGPGWRPAGMIYYSTREMGAWVKYLGQRAGRLYQGL